MTTPNQLGNNIKEVDTINIYAYNIKVDKTTFL